MSVMKTFCGCVSTKTGSLAILAFYIVSFIRKLESFLVSIQQFLVITFNIPVFLHPCVAPKILLTSRCYRSIYCFVKRTNRCVEAYVCVRLQLYKSMRHVMHETASPIQFHNNFHFLNYFNKHFEGSCELLGKQCDVLSICVI